MLILQVALGNVPRGVCLDPRLHYKRSSPRLSAELPCQELATDFFAFSSSSCTASIGRAGASKRRRLIMLISVDWLPPSLRPPGACLALGTRVCFSLLTPSRVTPHRGCVSSDAQAKPSDNDCEHSTVALYGVSGTSWAMAHINALSSH